MRMCASSDLCWAPSSPPHMEAPYPDFHIRHLLHGRIWCLSGVWKTPLWAWTASQVPSQNVCQSLSHLELSFLLLLGLEKTVKLQAWNKFSVSLVWSPVESGKKKKERHEFEGYESVRWVCWCWRHLASLRCAHHFLPASYMCKRVIRTSTIVDPFQTGESVQIFFSKSPDWIIHCCDWSTGLHQISHSNSIASASVKRWAVLVEMVYLHVLSSYGVTVINIFIIGFWGVKLAEFSDLWT